MEDLYSLFDQETDWILTGFFAFFSALIAIFYTVILLMLFKVNLKPKWLFFVVLPCVIIFTKLFYPPAVMGVFITVFIFTFILAISGFIYRFLADIISDAKKKVRKKKKGHVFTEVIFTLVVLGSVIIGFFFFGHLSFIIIFLFLFLKWIFSPNTKNVFLRLQATLPTSKIRSMAMGLVEVTGNVIMQEPVIARLAEKKCIGYTYQVESISRDKDGKNSYTTITYETVCNPFILQDTTGEVHVTNENLELLDLEIDTQYDSSSKRYTQRVLFDNTEVLLIGKASQRDRKPIIEKETIKNVFGLMPVHAISRWNTLKPLRDSAYTFATVILLLIALVLISDIQIENNQVILNYSTSPIAINFKDFLNI